MKEKRGKNPELIWEVGTPLPGAGSAAADHRGLEGWGGSEKKAARARTCV